LLDGYDVIMKPEVNGAIAIKERFPEAVLIFIVPDRFSLLQTRLEARRTETNDVIASRLAIAHEELRYVRLFDYLLVNEEAQPHVAVEDLEAIVRAERMRIYRYPDTRIKEIEEKLMSNSVFGDLDGLLSHVDSKFSLVNVVTKRAKQLNNGAPR